LQHISVVFFVGLLLTKVSAFHVYEHHTDNEHEDQCELCLLLIDSQQAETLTTPLTFSEEKFVPTRPQSKILIPDFQVISDVSKTDLFSRPPPSLHS